VPAVNAVEESNAYSSVRSDPLAIEMTFAVGVMVTGEDESALLPFKVFEVEIKKVTVVVSPFAVTFPFRVALKPLTDGFVVVALGAAFEDVKLRIEPSVVPRALSPTAWK
jgi:hypothetical protein